MLNQLNDVYLSLKLKCHTIDDIKFIITQMKEKDQSTFSFKNKYLFESIIQYFEIHFDELTKRFGREEYINFYEKKLNYLKEISKNSMSLYFSNLKKIYLILRKDPNAYVKNAIKFVKSINEKKHYLKVIAENLYDVFQIVENQNLRKEIMLLLKDNEVFAKEEYLDSIQYYFNLQYVKRGPFIRISTGQEEKMTKFKVRYNENTEELRVSGSSMVWELISNIITNCRINISFYSVFYYNYEKKYKIKKKHYNFSIDKFFSDAKKEVGSIIIDVNCKKNRTLQYLFFYGDKSFHPDIFDLIVIWARKCMEKNLKKCLLNFEHNCHNYRSEEELLSILFEKGKFNNFDFLNILIGFDNLDNPYLRNFKYIPEMDELLKEKPIKEEMNSNMEIEFKELITSYEENKQTKDKMLIISKIEKIIRNNINKKNKDFINHNSDFFCFFLMFFINEPKTINIQIIQNIKTALLENFPKSQIANIIKLNINEVKFIKDNVTKLDKSKINMNYLLYIFQRIINNRHFPKNSIIHFFEKVKPNKQNEMALVKCLFTFYMVNFPEKSFNLLSLFLSFNLLLLKVEILYKYFNSILNDFMLYEIPPPSNKKEISTLFELFIRKILQKYNSFDPDLLGHIFLFYNIYCETTNNCLTQENINELKKRVKNHQADFIFYYSTKIFLYNYKFYLIKKKIKTIEKLKFSSALKLILCFLFLEKIDINNLSDQFKSLFNNFKNGEVTELSQKISEIENKNQIKTIKGACEYFSQNNPKIPIIYISSQIKKEEIDLYYKENKYFIKDISVEKSYHENYTSNLFVGARGLYTSKSCSLIVKLAKSNIIIWNKANLTNSYLFLKRKNLKKLKDMELYFSFMELFKDFENVRQNFLFHDIRENKEFTFYFFCSFADFLARKEYESNKKIKDKSQLEFYKKEGSLEVSFTNRLGEFKIKNKKEFIDCLNKLKQYKLNTDDIDKEK